MKFYYTRTEDSSLPVRPYIISLEHDTNHDVLMDLLLWRFNNKSCYSDNVAKNNLEQLYYKLDHELIYY